MSKKVSTTIYIDPEQDRLLKELSKRTKVPVAVYIREGVDMLLKKMDRVMGTEASPVSEPGQDRTMGHG